MTEATIAKAVAAASGDNHATTMVDHAVDGLRLSISGSHAKWLLITAGLEGERLRIPLGSWPNIDLSSAREAAERVGRQFRIGGSADDGLMTVRRLLDIYDARKLQHLRRGQGARRTIQTALRAVLDHEANAVTRNDVRDAIDVIADRAPIQANRSLAYIKAMFSWALGRGYVDSNPAANLARPSREVSRDRAPDLEELAQIWSAACRLGYPFGDAIRVLMLTATRRDEVAAIRVDELDFQPDGSVVWTLPASRSKNGRAIRSALPPIAAEILRSASHLRPEGSALVFSTNGTTPISGWSKAKAQIDEWVAANGGAEGRPVAPWRFHDFRRSFATIASDRLGIDRTVADRCLNHVGSSTTSMISRVYARSEMFDQRRKALAEWSDAVTEAVLEATNNSPAEADCAEV